ncbi:MAG: flagellar biosynthetic protein FliR [Rhodobacteraceae bacterium]|nr:flagellar biosynthetic protein FliR [Paracoccaceae bacterium]
MTPDLLAALEALAAATAPWATAAVLVFLRIGAMAALLPAFGEMIVPLRVRLAVAAAFTLVVAPAVAPALPPLPETPLALAGLIAGEAAIGLMLGIGLRLFVMALQTAGTMAAQATSLAQFFGGANVDPQPAIAQVLVMGGLALALIFGLHVRLAELMILSYDMLPPGQGVSAGMVAEWGVARVAQSFALAFRLALPFVVIALLYNVTLGAINKAMPQLMVAFVGAPAITFAGLAVLLLAAPVMLSVWLDAFHGFLADPTAP